MLKIGNFARVGGVTIKSLHYYDSKNLLKPVHIDSFTGYRYYSIDQLPRLHRILALRDLGFSIEQIRLLLHDNVSLDDLHNMLRTKQASIQEVVKEEEARLKRIEARLKQIEQENTLLNYDITLKDTEAQTIVSIRAIVPTSQEVQQYCGTLVQRIATQCLAKDVPIEGTWMTLYHNGPYTGHDRDVEVEMALAIHQLAPGIIFDDNQVHACELSMGKVVSLVHTGDYDELWQAHFAMLDWANTNGYDDSGLYRQILLRGPREGTPITEAQLAITPSH
ncbi:MAG: MerR family transcriptional regulator [Chloroflexota bacterium]|nr:MerR family transcriptional regulator [Chloroflexota bacterium]